MKLDCVLTACNENPIYCEFIPYFIKAWKKLYPKIDVKIILINDNIPPEYTQYKDNIILFSPIPNISTAFISQYIRLLYPGILDYKGGVLISDIDMIPMNNTYYTKNIEQYNDNKFIYYRDWGLEINQLSMCYNIASSEIWSEIFNINSFDDINNRIIDIYINMTYKGPGKEGWDRDQCDLYKYVMEWNNRTHDFIYLRDDNTGKKRLGRNRPFEISKIADLINIGYYSDYHCLRPYSKFKKMNDLIYDNLPVNN